MLSGDETEGHSEILRLVLVVAQLLGDKSWGIGESRLGCEDDSWKLTQRKDQTVERI